MPSLEINHQPITVADGATVLDAARALGIDIPTLCHVPGVETTGACMVCAVKINDHPVLRPACATRAMDGMRVETDTPELHPIRRMAVELLLGDHLGDCEGPCERACPAHLPIPRILRHIETGAPQAAQHLLLQTSPLPKTLEWICPAPCERICRRGLLHAEGPAEVQPVAIRDLMRLAAGLTATKTSPASRNSAPHRRSVAVIGAGPAGLAAAFALCRQGAACTVLDRNATPGGSLVQHVKDGTLPSDALMADLERLANMGIEFRLHHPVPDPSALAAIRGNFKTVVLAIGDAIQQTGFTSGDGVWIAKGRNRGAARAVADGLSAARAVVRHWNEEDGIASPDDFNSHVGRPMPGETATWLAEAANPGPRGMVFPDPAHPDAARHEAARCLHCDCRKRDHCRLRAVAQAVTVRTNALHAATRRGVIPLTKAPGVVFDPGKCIACGACERITSRAGETPGLAFIGRGFQIRITIPFNAQLGDALRQTAQACINACPTGALSASEH